MSKKKLPPAITTAADISPREPTSSAASPEPGMARREPAAKAAAAAKKAIPSSRRPKARSSAHSASGPSEPAGPAAALSATDVGGGRSDGAATVEKSVPTLLSSATASPPRSRVDPVLKRRLALRIVDRHVAYSAVACLIPLPIVDFAAVTAIAVRMAKLLSDHYGVPFEQARVRALVSGMLGGAAAPGLAAVGTAGAARLIPGVQLFGLAVSSATAAAWTRGLGEMFVQSFEDGAGRIEIKSR